MKHTLILAIFLVVSTSTAFTVPTIYGARAPTLQLLKAESNERDETLKQLGFSDNELQRKVDSDFQQPTVRVDLIEDVDPITLTAIGFALIAANFLVFANLGDGGIAGLVATAINLSRQ